MFAISVVHIMYHVALLTCSIFKTKDGYVLDSITSDNDIIFTALETTEITTHKITVFY
jgi:hypothetical protein